MLDLILPVARLSVCKTLCSVFFIRSINDTEMMSDRNVSVPREKKMQLGLGSTSGIREFRFSGRIHQSSISFCQSSETG